MLVSSGSAAGISGNASLLEQAAKDKATAKMISSFKYFFLYIPPIFYCIISEIIVN